LGLLVIPYRSPKCYPLVDLLVYYNKTTFGSNPSSLWPSPSSSLVACSSTMYAEKKVFDTATPGCTGLSDDAPFVRAVASSSELASSTSTSSGYGVFGMTFLFCFGVTRDELNRALDRALPLAARGVEVLATGVSGTTRERGVCGLPIGGVGVRLRTNWLIMNASS
jgi:hypothetical protein